jgi:hypothetical protein
MKKLIEFIKKFKNKTIGILGGIIIFFISIFLILKSQYITKTRAEITEFNFKIKIQGDFKNKKNIYYKSSIIFYTPYEKKYEFENLNFRLTEDNIFTANLSVPNFDKNNIYSFFIKPENYLGRIFSNYVIENNSNDIDLTNKIFFAGDIYPYDGQVSAYDMSKIFGNLGKEINETDLNKDGITDIQDYLMALYTMKNDFKEEQITLFPKPTPTSTTNPTHSPIPTTSNPSPTPISPSPPNAYLSTFFLERNLSKNDPIPPSTPGKNTYDGIIDVFWNKIEVQRGVYDFSEIERRIADTSAINYFIDGRSQPRKYILKITGTYTDLQTQKPKAEVPDDYKITVTCPSQYRLRDGEEKDFIGEYPNYKSREMRNAWHRLTETLAQRYNSDERISAIIFGLGAVEEARAAKNTPLCNWYQWSIDSGMHSAYINDFLGIRPSDPQEIGTIKKHRDLFTQKVTYWPLGILSPYERRQVFNYIQTIQTNPPRIGYANYAFDWYMPGAHFSNSNLAGFNDWYLEYPSWPALGENKRLFYYDFEFYWTILTALRFNLNYFDAYWQELRRGENIVWLPELTQRSGKIKPQYSTNIWIAFRETIYTDAFLNNCQSSPRYDRCLGDNNINYRCDDVRGDLTYGINRTNTDLSQIAAGPKNNNICNFNFGFEELPFAQKAAVESVPGLMARKTGSDGYIKLKINDNWIYKNYGNYKVKFILLNNHQTPTANNHKALFQYFDTQGQRKILTIEKDSSQPETTKPWIIKEFNNLKIRFNKDFDQEADFIISDAQDGADYFHMIWIIVD